MSCLVINDTDRHTEGRCVVSSYTDCPVVCLLYRWHTMPACLCVLGVVDDTVYQLTSRR